MSNTSNDDVGGDVPRIAGIYARWTLDYVVKAARAIALDFTRRPRQYKSVPSEIAGTLEEMWFHYGNDPGFPDYAQREMICMPLVGESEGGAGEKTAQFHTSAAALRARAWDFSNRQVTTGEDNLRVAFLDDLVPFRSYLETMRDNVVVTNGSRQQNHVFDHAVSILENNAVAGVFGRPAPSVAGWPLGASFDETGARLIEEISMALEIESGPVSQSRFIVLQRVAHYGALTISGALAADIEPSPLDSVDPLISVAYSWHTAISALGT